VFQEPRLMPWLSVAENVGFGLRHVPRPDRVARVETALARVGLADAARRLPKELSGGMAQRAALARALVARPPLLLLDEPFSALDALLRADLQEHLVELWREERPTMVLVTHDIEEAALIADRVLVLQGGPGRIAGDFKVDLVRPRDKFEPAFASLADRLLAALDRATRRRMPGEVAHPAAAI
jgi:sulfonate transport system ATP-binding protein